MSMFDFRRGAPRGGRLAVAALLAVLSTLAGRPAFAQGCPIGTHMLGGGNAGWWACAPIPGSETVLVPNDPTPSWAQGPSIDPLAGRIEAATTLFQLEAQKSQELKARIAKDPAFAAQYRDYVKGTWQNFRQAPSAPPGEYCAALFTREGNAVAVVGPGGENSGALLIFSGRDVPTPESPAKVKVTLDQTDSPSQTVLAYNHRLTGAGRGAMTLAVPTVDGLLDGILDTHRFELTLDGQSIYKIEWHGGFAARDALKRCIANRK